MAQGYQLYGARGIAVCETWHDFMTFYTDLGPRPSSRHSLERKNNAHGYTPDNCIWATALVQSRNTRRNILITYNGITQCLQQWSLSTGILADTIGRRLKHGWPIKEALTLMPSHSNKSKALFKSP
jgi:IMP cyclohydrolase